MIRGSRDKPLRSNCVLYFAGSPPDLKWHMKCFLLNDFSDYTDSGMTVALQSPLPEQQ